ncbi:MAG: hypothetical protein QOK05_493 [Chloroflexota bacterium]|nr:hypothetical protein [Chloroflexota bacterium]
MRPTRLVLALGLAAVILGAGAFTAIASPAFHLATTPSPSASPKPGAAKAKAACDAFVADLAHRLGVTTDKLTTSVKDSLKKAIDDAVARGDMTADQATKAKARIDASQGCQGLGNFHGFAGPKGPGGGFGGPRVQVFEQVVTAAAAALQQPAADVKKDIMSGQSLHDVANLKNISKAQFDTAFKAALKSQTDPLVTAKTITAEQQTKLIDEASTMAGKLWDSSLKDLGGPFGKKSGSGPAGTKPSTTTIQ